MNAIISRPNAVAGIIRALCECCPQPTQLVGHVQLGAARLLCPTTRRTYLDRGDGVYQPDGQVAEAALLSRAEAPRPAEPVVEAEVLSDRPARTSDKVRISLERATFA